MVLALTPSCQADGQYRQMCMLTLTNPLVDHRDREVETLSIIEMHCQFDVLGPSKGFRDDLL